VREGCSGDLLPPSPPAEQATASCTDNGAGDNKLASDLTTTRVSYGVDIKARSLRSFAPERFAKKVIGVAWAASAGRISAAANASEQEPIEMRGGDSFVFASLAQDKNCGCA
jgi:hypothetical protein